MNTQIGAQDFGFLNSGQALINDSTRYAAGSLAQLGSDITESVSLNNARKEAETYAPLMADSFRKSFELLEAGDIGGGLSGVFATSSQFAQNPILARISEDAIKSASILASTSMRNDIAQLRLQMAGQSKFQTAHDKWAANEAKADAYDQYAPEGAPRATRYPEPTMEEFMQNPSMSNEADIIDQEATTALPKPEVSGDVSDGVVPGAGPTTISNPDAVPNPSSDATTPTAPSNAQQGPSLTPYQQDLIAQKAKQNGITVLSRNPQAISLSGGVTYIQDNRADSTVKSTTLNPSTNSVSITYENGNTKELPLPKEQIKSFTEGATAINGVPAISDALTKAGGAGNNRLVFKDISGDPAHPQYSIGILGDSSRSSDEKQITERDPNGIERPIIVNDSFKEKWEAYKSSMEEAQGGLPLGKDVFLKFEPVQGSSDAYYDNTKGKTPFDENIGNVLQNIGADVTKLDENKAAILTETVRRSWWDAFDDTVKEEGIDSAKMESIRQSPSELNDFKTKVADKLLANLKKDKQLSPFIKEREKEEKQEEKAPDDYETVKASGIFSPETLKNIDSGVAKSTSVKESFNKTIEERGVKRQQSMEASKGQQAKRSEDLKKIEAATRLLRNAQGQMPKEQYQKALLELNEKRRKLLGR